MYPAAAPQSGDVCIWCLNGRHDDCAVRVFVRVDAWAVTMVLCRCRCRIVPPTSPPPDSLTTDGPVGTISSAGG